MRPKNQMTMTQARRASKERQVRRLAKEMTYAGLPAPERELSFCPGRRWRFDLSYPGLKLAIEYEGGTWSAQSTRHVSGVGYRNDCEKYNAAQTLGWVVVRITADMLDDGKGLAWIERAYAIRKGDDG